MVYFGLNLPLKSDKKLRALPRFAQPFGLIRLKSPVKIRSKIRELCLASVDHVVYFGLNLRWRSDQKLNTLASLRSVMWFILAKISRQNQIKKLRALPRFARPCGLYWLQPPVEISSKIWELCFASLDHVGYFDSFASLRSTTWVISAQISGQKQIKNLIALLPFARRCGLFWLQPPVKFTGKFQDLCLASLNHVVYFYFGSNLRSKFDQKFDSFNSLRSTMWFILALTTR